MCIFRSTLYNYCYPFLYFVWFDLYNWLIDWLFFWGGGVSRGEGKGSKNCFFPKPKLWFKLIIFKTLNFRSGTPNRRMKPKPESFGFENTLWTKFCLYLHKEKRNNVDSGYWQWLTCISFRIQLTPPPLYSAKQ